MGTRVGSRLMCGQAGYIVPFDIQGRNPYRGHSEEPLILRGQKESL